MRSRTGAVKLAMVSLLGACAEPAPTPVQTNQGGVAAGGTAAMPLTPGSTAGAPAAVDTSAGVASMGGGGMVDVGMVDVGMVDVGMVDVGMVDVGMAGAPGAASGAGPSYASTVEPIFVELCTAGCHSGSGTLGGVDGLNADSQLDLVVGAGYAPLAGQNSLQVTTMPLVGATPQESYLWYKITGTHLDVGGSGASMPLGSTVAGEQLAAVEAWILGGAAP